MPIIDVSDLETYMGVSFSDTQAAQAAYIVNYVNGWINDTCDTSFGTTTGFVMRVKADVDGRYIFHNLPIQQITLVHDVFTDSDFTSDGWIFDGIDTLWPFYPGQIIDVTLDYGVTPVPDSITGVALAMGKRGMSALLSNTDERLILKQVGDVIYQFGDVLAPNKYEQSILDTYGNTEYTIRVGTDNTILRNPLYDYPIIPNVSFLP